MPRAKGTVLKPVSTTKSQRKPAGGDTPAMRQYNTFKAQHPDCVLFFRMGDFYEMFHDDAVNVARALDLTLTERTPGVPMAGVPHHAAESYLRRLVEQGFRVAVCEQIQDPKEAKGVVDRAVTRVVTPGTRVDEALLPDAAAGALAAAMWTVNPNDNTPAVAIATIELSTGTFTADLVPANNAADTLARRGVEELLYPDTADGTPPPAIQQLEQQLSIARTPRAPWQFRHAEALEHTLAHYAVTTLQGFGIPDDHPCIGAIGAALAYLHETQGSTHSATDSNNTNARERLAHIAPPKLEQPGNRLILDAVSLRALEIERTVRTGALDGSLLSIFCKGPSAPKTAMGKRLIRNWLIAPLANTDHIEQRHAATATLTEDARLRDELRDTLTPVADAARIAARAALLRATPRDIVALGSSLHTLDPLINALDNTPALQHIRTALSNLRDTLAPLGSRIRDTCVEHPPPHLREGGLVRDGIDQQLDQARHDKTRGTEWLATYQKQLTDTHDLPSLKVGYNKVFGYYIELPAAQAKRAPDSFTRKQTLKNAERYITPELKQFEDRVLGAGERAIAREQAIFAGLLEAVRAQAPAIARFGEAVAELDALACFADKAVRRGWTRPTITDQPLLRIDEGRHPVLDETLGSSFVPNSIALGSPTGADNTSDNEGGGLALITGPNMAGKSTYIRQVALITVLAHAGSFVPADHATIGLTDRVFTRVGADDALHAGQSTFMVEMVETANILNHATPKSLVVLDEIGRGTSTLDGLSLAWAITERLAGVAENDPHASACRTLFATHYHELTELAERHQGRIANLHVSVSRHAGDIVFLHRILPGRAEESFGVQVAKMAGLPAPVTTRAAQLLESLRVEHGHIAPHTNATTQRTKQRSDANQMALFTEYVNHPVIEELKSLDITSLSPMQAFDLLRTIREKLD